MARQLRNRLVHRISDREMMRMAPKYLRGRMIDIGCGVKPYRQMLAPFVEQHVGLEFAGTKKGMDNVDLVGSAYEIPEADATFDSALCTAVLEHLEEPEKALRECLRVLKPGAVAVYTIPFHWHIHEAPRDFYRFTKYGIEYLFTKAGFEILELVPLAGFWVTHTQGLSYYLDRFNRGPLRWFRIVDALMLVVQGWGLLMHRVDRTHGWTWMYAVAARRPLEAPA